jgi:ankyrin repeat protein
VEILRCLLDAGAAIDALDADGSSALMKAALWGHASVVTELLTRGADPTLTDTGRWTALSIAVQQGHREVIPLLLGRPAS